MHPTAGSKQSGCKLSQAWYPFNRIRLKNEYTDPPHHKIEPLDTHKLEELKKTLTTWLDSNQIILCDSPYGALILFA